MIRPASLAAFARDVAHATALGTIVAALADYATTEKHLRNHAAALEDANTRLRYERDVLEKHATRLMDANRDLCAAITSLTTLDPDDAEEYEPTAPVWGPAVEAQVAEYRERLEAWGGEVE